MTCAECIAHANDPATSQVLSTQSAGIEDLREKREEVQKQIRDEEGEKAKLQQDLQLLTKRLAHINDALARKVCFEFACRSDVCQLHA